MPDKDSQIDAQMPDKDHQNSAMRLPQGFTVHSSKRSSEYARELGWGINEEERTKTPQEKQNYDGGRNYDYGSRDFGDTAVDTSSAKPPADRNKLRPVRHKKPAA